MDGNEKGGSKRRADDVYSQSLRAGNRTYFFDVKSTKSDDLYLTITESKRRFNNDNGKFYYEKHKLFLYPEDFAEFCDYLNGTLDKIKELNGGVEATPRADLESDEEGNAEMQENNNDQSPKSESSSSAEKDPTKAFSDVSFEDLGKD
jgi:hypothetical protein